MPTKDTTSIKIPSYKTLLKTGVYDKILNRLYQNPIEAHKEIQVLLETDNQLSRNKNAIEILEHLKDDLNVSSTQLEKTYKIYSLPSYAKENLIKNPEKLKKAYTEMYNIYTYDTTIPLKQKLIIRKHLHTIGDLLWKANINPDNLLKRESAVMKGVSFLGKLFNVPINVILQPAKYIIQYAKGVDVNPKFKDFWSETAWEGFLTELRNNKYTRNLMEKAKKGIPLTNKEKTDLRRFTNQNKWVGFVLDIVADPLNFAGGIVAKITGKGAKGLKGLKTVDNIADRFKGLARSMRFLANAYDKTSNAYKAYDKVKVLTEEVLKMTTKMGKGKIPAKFAGKLREFDFNLAKTNMEKAYNELLRVGIKNIDDFKTSLDELSKAYDIINSSKKALREGSKLQRLTAKGIENIKKLANRVAEFTGIRKLLIGDMPTMVEVLDETGKVTKVLDPNKTVKAAKRIADYYSTKVAYNDDVIRKIISKIKRENKDLLEGVKKAIKEGKTYVRNADEYLNDMIIDSIESKKYLEKYISEGWKIDPDDIAELKKVNEDLIIEQIKYTPERIKPLNLNPDKVDRWNKVAKDYSDLWKVNPDAPDLEKLESELRGLMRETGEVRLLDGVGEEVKDNLSYLAHIITPEAREWLLKSGKRIKKQENAQLAIKTLLDFSKPEELEKNLNKLIYSLTHKHVPSSKMGFALKRELDGTINGLNRYMNSLGFKGKFFETDLRKIYALRGKGLARSVQQEMFVEGIKQFGRKTLRENDKLSDFKLLEPSDKIPTALTGDSGIFYHKDIAKAIENMFTAFHDDTILKRIWYAIGDIIKMWKATTLGLFPGTVARNILGNFTNSLLSLDNLMPGKIKGLVKSWWDAFLFGVAKKNYRIKLPGGTTYLSDLWEEFIRRGGTGSSFMKEILPDINRYGVVEKSRLTQFAEKFNKTVYSFPIAKFNENAELASKFALFINELKNGRNYDEAIESVFKYLFDYSDLTRAEKSIREVIPFFTFTRKNLGLQLTHLLSQPTRVFMKIASNIDVYRPGDKTIDERFMSDWLKEAPTIRITPKRGGIIDKVFGLKGRPGYILLEGLIPTFDLARVFRVIDKRGLNNLLDDVVSDVAPLLKTPLENFINYSFTFKRPIKKSEFSQAEFLGIRMSPKLKNWLDDIRILTTAERAGISLAVKPQTMTKPERDIIRGIMSYLFFVPMDYDAEFSRKITSSQFIKNVHNELKEYKLWINKLLDKWYTEQTAQPTKADLNDIVTRGASILEMIMKGYNSGLIDRKARGKMVANLLKNFLLGSEELQKAVIKNIKNAYKKGLIKKSDIIKYNQLVKEKIAKGEL